MSERRCSVEGCTGQYRAKGYCGAHYERWRRTPDFEERSLEWQRRTTRPSWSDVYPDGPPPRNGPFADSHPRCGCHGEPMLWNKQPRARGYPDGGVWKCRTRTREHNINGLERQMSDPEKAAAIRRSKRTTQLRAFGLTIEQYDALLAEQGGVCAICGCPPGNGRLRRHAVDHCHDSGRVRGILCITCNTTLGRFERHREAMLAYLAR